MGKKVAAPAPQVIPPSKKARAPAAAAAQPQEAAAIDLQDASAFVNNIPADVLYALAKAKSPAIVEIDSDDAD